MSSTNKTTYYELPQFVDNDIFNPLVDDNDAYSKIDTALHNIANAEADDASEIVGIKSRLDSAEGDIDAIETQNGNSVLTTTAQTLSGAVNELDADVGSVAGRVAVVEDDINNVSTGLKTKVSALEAQNGNSVLTTTAQTLSGAINELDSDIAGLQTKYAQRQLFTGRKFIFISDSYGAMTTMLQEVVAKMGLTTDQYSINAQSGISFTDLGNGRFIDRLVDGIANFDNPSEITDIIVVGGLNDSSNAYSDSGQLLAAMTAFDNYAKTYAPNAKIHVGYIGHVDISNANSSNRDWYKQLITIKRYITNAGTLGWHYFTNIENTMHGVIDYLSSDGVHPSSDGATALANAIVLSITGTYDDLYTMPSLSNALTVSSTINGTVDSFMLGPYVKHNGMITSTVNDFEITYDYDAPAIFSNIHTALYFSDYPFVEITGGTPFIYFTSGTLLYNDGSDKYMECMVQIAFKQGNIDIHPIPFINGSTSWVNGTPKKLSVKAFSFNLETLRV